MTKIKVGVFGAAGRMGATVCQAVVADPDLELVAAVDPLHTGIDLHQLGVPSSLHVARSAEEAERQARGESRLAAREETSMDDLGLEVGAALAEAGDVEL